MSLEAGQTLSHYRLIEKIGEGGMGAVWKAYDTTLDRDVAIKVLPEAFAMEASRLARLEREAKAVAALNHPNIVTVHSVETDPGGVHFFTMELVRGKPLANEIPQDGLQLDRLLDLAIPLAEAISAAHEQGITHRDLKPANVMVTADKRVKVLDFGLAKLAQDTHPEGTEAPTRSLSLTGDGQLVGTVPYMSPEQLEGQPVDHRSDIFSLGVMLYQMATGRHPFPGKTSAQVMAAILKESPDAVTAHRSDLPADLGRIVIHCLQKDRERRYQTAKGLRNELQELRETSSSSAVTAPPDVARTAVAKRRTGWLAAAAVTVVAGAVASAILWRQPNAESQSRLQRIVVLPFQNLGPPDDAYFASGMTEEITSRLAVVSGMAVISRTSAEQYADTDATIEQIGKELDVGYVLGGTVRWARQGEGRSRVRITPQLIRVADDTQIWTRSYDEELADVFTVQSAIAEQVVAQLGVALREPERQRIQTIPTRNLEAYEFYLRGKDHSHTATHDRHDAMLALEMLQKAVDLDGEFALGFAALATAHGALYHYSYDRSDERRALAKAAIERALELDPESPEVRRELSVYYYWVEQDYERALAEATAIASRLPNDVDLVTWMTAILRRQGRWEEALVTARKAFELSPRDPGSVRSLARTLYLMRRYEESEEYFDRLIAVGPDRPMFYHLTAVLYRAWKGTTAEARATLEAMPDTGLARDFWSTQLMLEGDYAGSLELLRGLATPPTEQGVAERALRLAWHHELLNEPLPARTAYASAAKILEQEARARPDDAFVLSSLGLAYAGLGRKSDSIRLGKTAVERLPPSKDAIRGTIVVTRLARIYTIVGDHDSALDQLDVVLAIPSHVSVPLLLLEPVWRPLWDHPRFQELVERYEAASPTAGKG